jgi:hypothetical protein
VRGDICTICCGTEREVTVECPLECPYLQEARKHERLPPPETADIPNKDIRVSENFLNDHETLLTAAARGLLGAAFDVPGAVDYDVRDTLDALIRTYRTLNSGVYYETRPENARANQIYGPVQQAMEEYRKAEAERLGMTRTRDADVLTMLVFFQRLELDYNNGRPRGRAFLDLLRSYVSREDGRVPEPRASSLILP